MNIRQGISIGNLLLDVGNYRHGKLSSQKAARDAIIADQGRKLVKLAEDIIQHGLNPIDITMVIDAEDGNQNFIVAEGNRRLSCIQLMNDPDLAKDTPVHKAFSKLNKDHADAIPKVLDCVIVPNRKIARIWIDRKHAIGLEGAGTENWSAMANARADVDAGEKRPELDVVNFVLTNAGLVDKLRHHLEGSGFALTTLQRLVTTKELQDAAGFKLSNDKFVATSDKGWLQGVLTDLVTTIATGKRNGSKFTERNIDDAEKRETFIKSLVADHPKGKKSKQAWTVTGTPKPVTTSPKPTKAPPTKGTQSTEEQDCLIPKKYKLELPNGKINDIFIEMKNLKINTYRHSVSVLLRVFIEISLEEYIKTHSIQLPIKSGTTDDRLITKLSKVVAHVKSTGLMNTNELKSVNVAISDRDSLLSPETLNKYVHSRWMNPDPMQLKVSWLSIQLFLERLWTSKK